jgi:prepilin signal peptidase PulO-like enzyme (type II secretory pathway)
MLTLPGTLFGLAAAMLTPGGVHRALFGVVFGSGLLWLLAWIWIRFRKIEGMGFGDVKLAAMIGVVLGWQLTLLTLFVAALAGSLWGAVLLVRREGTGKTALPFGTLLAPASLIVLLWGDRWLAAYLGMFTGR